MIKHVPGMIEVKVCDRCKKHDYMIGVVIHQLIVDRPYAGVEWVMLHLCDGCVLALHTEYTKESGA